MPHYHDDIATLSENDLQGFFVGWPNPPSPAVHLQLLRKTQYRVIAQDEESGQVLGFITAISDGLLSAYIPLLEVLPSHRGQGIGSELVRTMLGKLNHLYMIDLLCDEDLQPFYERLTFRKATGMLRRNYERQSGG